LSLTIAWHGAELTLLPERALWWETHRCLLLADLHLGKDAAFRYAGSALPPGQMEADLLRLGRLAARLDAQRILVLGDLVHAHTGLTERVIESFSRWRSARPGIAVELITGNHDRRSGIPAAWEIAEHQTLVVDGITLQHSPEEESDGPTIGGHLHPNVRLSGPGRGSEVYPCFWVQQQRLVLPAFTTFSGRVCIQPTPTDHVYITNGEEIVEANLQIQSPPGYRR
jgi:uncharacterized protein